MNRRTFALIGLLLCSTAYAAGTSIWNATDRGTVAATDRLPVATSSSSGPLYVTPLTLQSYLLSGSATTEVLANNAGAFDGDSGFTFNATNNSVDLGGATLTASDPVLDLSQTWNNGAVTFTGLKLNVTNTASATASLLMDVQLNGSSLFSVVGGTKSIEVGGTAGNGAVFGKGTFNADAYIGADFYFGNAAGFFGASNNVIGFSTSANPGSTAPTLQAGFYSDAAAVISQRNSTTAQTFRVYDTYADASNYGRIALNTNLTGDWVQVAAETAGTGADNYGIALTSAGTGAISAQVPTTSTAGGNARGANAVDWQADRNAADQVASGSLAVVSGGRRNTASGAYSTVSGGDENTASAPQGVVSGGIGNFASGPGYSTVAGGSSNFATNSGATVAGGILNTASGVASWIPGGYDATTRGLYGAYAYQSTKRALPGDAQVIGQPVRRTTTDATPVSLAADGTPAATTVMVLPSDSTATCTGIVTANNNAAGTISMAGFKVDAIVKNDSSTITISGGTCTAIGTADAALTTATCALVANGTLDSIEMQVTGVAATTIYWVAEVKCVQAL